MEKEGQAGIEVFLGLSWPCAPPVASFQVDENVDRYFFDNVGDVVVELLGETLFPVNTQPLKEPWVVFIFKDFSTQLSQIPRLNLIQ